MNRNRQIQFIDRLSSLIDSGISMEEALTIIINMESIHKIRKIIIEIREKVRKGISLSNSMHSSYKSFDPILLSMISYGEYSGALSLSIKQAKDILEKSKNIKKKIIGALIYPSFIAFATIAMTIFLVIYIFPKIMPLFIGMNIKLPLLTRFVRKIYEYSIHYGLWISILFILIILFFSYLYRKKHYIKYNIQKLLISLPIFGEIMKKYSLSINCRSIGTLMEYGQSLENILKQENNFIILEPYKKSWIKARTEILTGITISEYMNNDRSLFPTLVPDMLSIGEKTGTLGIMFGNIARIYDEEIDSFIKQISSFIEPILMIFMGIIVGSIALSIILPIYEITNHLSN